jgi:hypothetical protein
MSIIFFFALPLVSSQLWFLAEKYAGDARDTTLSSFNRDLALHNSLCLRMSGWAVAVAVVFFSFVVMCNCVVVSD